MAPRKASNANPQIAKNRLRRASQDEAQNAAASHKALETLQREMEVVEKPRNATGHQVRRVPKSKALARTRKRKQLETEDFHLATEEDVTEPAQRKGHRRGAKSAEDEAIINGSLVFGISTPKDNNSEQEGDPESSEDDGNQKQFETDTTLESLKQNKAKKRRLYRLRNFTSMKLAQRHGEAIGAHARGQPKLAIEKLKQVAAQAPSAPQVYSSLGMVFEDMLRQKERNQDEQEAAASAATVEERLNLAKKAYGSYHVAALLCRKDYTLWLRAADIATRLADTYTEMLVAALDANLEDTKSATEQYYRSEKLRWTKQCRNDYQFAANLNPPGLEVPLKLTSALLTLCRLPDALTLLTDLKNSTDIDGRSLFEESFEAWLLYSDLMLKIGYQCHRWNSNTDQAPTVDHTMKRWLKKFSATFDWKERRLHALTKALEAAAGSSCCETLVAVMSDRAAQRLGNDAEKVDSSESEGQGQNADCAEMTGSVYHLEKARMVEESQTALKNFDQTTEDLVLDLEKNAKEAREEARELLLETQNTNIASLSDKHRTDVADPNPISYISSVALPVSASCRIVCEIARDLLVQMLEMGVGQHGKHVVQATSMYMKARFSRMRERKNKVREGQGDLSSQPFSLLGLSSPAYDKMVVVQNQSDMSASDDEEVFDDDAYVLACMERGVLPPEIQFLYGVCLGCEPKKAFAAIKCVEIVARLEQEPISWYSDRVFDTEAICDPAWCLWLQKATQPLRVSSALAILASTMKLPAFQIEKKAFTKIFRAQVEHLFKSVGTAHNLKDMIPARRELVGGLLVTSSLCEVSELDDVELEEIPARRCEVFTWLCQCLKFMWEVDSRTAAPSSDCLLQIAAMARCSSWFIAALGSEGTRDRFDMFRTIAYRLSNADSEVTTTTPLGVPLFDFVNVPFSCSWLSKETQKLSVTAYNCAVALNCSDFSGWEKDQFNSSLIRKADGSTYNSLNFDSVVVSGSLPADFVQDLEEQWSSLQTLSPRFDGDAILGAIRKYRKLTENCASTFNTKGENHALRILLAFSRACVHQLSSAHNEGDERKLVICESLAVLLPLTQFVLNETLWESSIGKVTAAVAVSKSRQAKTSVSTQGTPTKRRKRTDAPINKEGVYRTLAWLGKDYSGDPLVHKLRVPMQTILDKWKGCMTETATSECVDAMTKLDSSMRDLRSSDSLHAVQSQVLAVAASLLLVASDARCDNPFVCLQQAARFASQVRLTGSCPSLLKTPLPNMAACTSSDALSILGRADCLMVLRFYEEAAFLCSFVLRVLADVRKLQRFDDRWRVVSVLVFNQAVLLRATEKGITVQHAGKRTSVNMWLVDDVEELECAGKIAMSWSDDRGLSPPL